VTAEYSDSYLTCLSLLSMAEQGVYINNIKLFPHLPRLWISFRSGSYNNRVPVSPFTLAFRSILCFALRPFPDVYGMRILIYNIQTRPTFSELSDS